LLSGASRAFARFQNGLDEASAQPVAVKDGRRPGLIVIAQLAAAAALQHEEPDRARQIAAALGVDLR